MSMVTFQQRLQALDARTSWQAQSEPYAYENFAYDCRDAALQLAGEGKLNDAYSVIKLIKSNDLETDNKTLWSDFHAGVEKATKNYFEKRLQTLDARPSWQAQSQPYAYENLAYDCRDAALKLAVEGHFDAALSVIKVIKLADIESENETLWSDFQTGFAKAIQTATKI